MKPKHSLYLSSNGLHYLLCGGTAQAWMDTANPFEVPSCEGCLSYLRGIFRQGIDWDLEDYSQSRQEIVLTAHDIYRGCEL